MPERSALNLTMRAPVCNTGVTFEEARADTNAFQDQKIAFDGVHQVQQMHRLSISVQSTVHCTVQRASHYLVRVAAELVGSLLHVRPRDPVDPAPISAKLRLPTVDSCLSHWYSINTRVDRRWYCSGTPVLQMPRAPLQDIAGESSDTVQIQLCSHSVRHREASTLVSRGCLTEVAS